MLNTTVTVPPPSVLAADIDLRRLAAALALAVFVGAGAVFALWLVGDAGLKTPLSFTMEIR